MAAFPTAEARAGGLVLVITPVLLVTADIAVGVGVVQGLQGSDLDVEPRIKDKASCLGRAYGLRGFVGYPALNAISTEILDEIVERNIVVHLVEQSHLLEIGSHFPPGGHQVLELGEGGLGVLGWLVAGQLSKSVSQ